MKCKCNKMLIGLLIGTLLPIITSFLIYAFRYQGDANYWTFITTMFKIHALTKLLSLSVLPNLIIFYIAIKTERLLAARGIVTATLIYAILVIGFKFLS